MLTKEFQNALKIIAEKMVSNDINWAVIGSTNCTLQGMEIIPKDLDIVVKLGDLHKIPKIFHGYNSSQVKELPTMTDEPAWEVKIEIDSVPIQILGEKDTGQYVSKLVNGRFKEIKVNKISIPCFTLDVEADAYAETNRLQKAERIREFL